jgi:hypothetical protein
MRSLLVCGALSILSVAMGCSSTPPLPTSASMSQSNQPTTTTHGSGGASPTGAAGSISVGASGGAGAGGGMVVTGAGGATQSGGASTCDRPAGDRFRPSSLAELQQTIRGTWVLCSNVGLFDQPQAGILIGDDDQYVLLDLVGGRLVRRTGLQNKGHLEYLDASGSGSGFSAQVDFVSDMGLTIIAAPPVFSDDPRLLFINNEGVEMYTYARATPLPENTGTAGATGATTGAGGATGGGATEIAQPTGGSGCDRPAGDRLRTSSIEEVQSTIHGTWLLCSSLGLFRQPQAGMFIAPDESYVFLDLVGGKLVPKTGLFNKGHLEYLDTSSFNGPGSTQVNFVSDMGGTIDALPIFSGDPRQLIIDNNGVDTYTYGFVP